MGIYIPFSNPTKVSFDLGNDLLTLSFAERLVDPLNRVFVLFAIIASIEAILLAMTKGNDIGRNRARAFRIAQRYPMVSGYDMPKTSSASTSGATPIKISETYSPIRSGKIIWQVAFSRLSSLKIYLSLLQMFFAIFMIVFSQPRLIVFLVLRLISLFLIAVDFVVMIGGNTRAILAPITEIIAARFILGKFRMELKAIAFPAILEAGREIQHSVYPYANILDETVRWADISHFSPRRARPSERYFTSVRLNPPLAELRRKAR